MRKMNFGITIMAVLILTGFLAGCSGAGGAAEPQGASTLTSTAAGPLKIDYENALPVNTQLAVGLFKLDETSAPLTKEQAGVLAPLWKAYRSLTTEEGSSKEVEALIVQIQEALDEDQLQAIAGMQLTMQDMAQLAEEKNLPMGGGGGMGLSAEERATRQAQRFSGQGGGPGGGGGMGPPGGMLPGGMPPGGGGIMPGGEMPPGAMATPGARQTAVAGRPADANNLVNPGLIEALITFLETKAQ